MPIQVQRNKWILYKHTSDYEMIKAVASDIKKNCSSIIDKEERYGMQQRLSDIDMYTMRNLTDKPLDSINHRINTLEFYMFGYEDDSKRFIFSPLGNLFLKHIDNKDATKKIFTAMLFGIQFEHWANSTPEEFQLYPFRLLLKLMTDKRMDYKLYSTEYAYLVAFQKNVTPESYDALVNQLLEFRKMTDAQKMELLLEDEHTYVNCIYEWQYYTQKLLSTAGVLEVVPGDSIGRLAHPQKPSSKSIKTTRIVRNGYASVSADIRDFVGKMLSEYSAFEKPLRLNDEYRMQLDVVKEIYSFYPMVLLEEIGERLDELQTRLLELPKLIERYSENPDNETAYLFEEVLKDGMNMFVNIEARRIGGAGHTDVECLYITKRKKFAVEAKSTANRLTSINAARLREHRRQIGGEYTIVVTPRYVPAVIRDIMDAPIVIILASTFSEYLYNHVFHDMREIDYKDFDDIVINNLGKDISPLISNMTLEKFAVCS